MTDFVATLYVNPNRVYWRASDVPGLLAQALHPSDAPPDPMVSRTELRRFASADALASKAGPQLTKAELADLDRACKSEGLPALPNELPYSEWGPFLDASNTGAERRGWWAGLIPPADPDETQRLAAVLYEEQNTKKLREWLNSGRVQAKIAGSFLPADVPLTTQLSNLVLMRDDLERFAALAQIQVKNAWPQTMPNGPDYWTIENAFADLAKQAGLHEGARDTLRDDMMQAASDGTLTVRHPHTGRAYRPKVVRGFYELVTPADVNAWLATDPGAKLRWQAGPSSTDGTKHRHDQAGAEAAPVSENGPSHATDGSDACEVANSATPATQTPNQRRTWRDVAGRYIVDVIRAGQYGTAKELYKALEAKAGPESPFEKGTGLNRGRLFVRELTRHLSQKTVQTNWKALRELAAKKLP